LFQITQFTSCLTKNKQNWLQLIFMQTSRSWCYDEYVQMRLKTHNCQTSSFDMFDITTRKSLNAIEN
jgi:hypothetical protein